MPQDGTQLAGHQSIVVNARAPESCCHCARKISKLTNERLSRFVGRMHAHVNVPCEQNEHPDAQPQSTSKHPKGALLGSPFSTDIIKGLVRIPELQIAGSAADSLAVGARRLLERAPCDNDCQT